ncbi:hypothetical protein ACWEO2_07090 [Nocardia sp. NPDC004278]|uniref:hypothetical protein n=1 Tax=Nocardia sp. NPDC005998 TaxID=3156894 RepID=UPI0033AED46E
MFNDYAAVDSHSLNVKAVLHGMDTNATHLASLIKELDQVFTGFAADVAKPLMDRFKAALGDASQHTGYQGQLQQVNQAISQTTGSEGFMKETDHQQGARFLAIGGV